MEDYFAKRKANGMAILENETIRWTDGTQKRVFDISVSLSLKTPVFPGQPRFQKNLLSSLARGDRSNVSELSLTSHTGTHVDSPHHFIENMETIDKIPFKRIIGPARVFELNVSQKIDATDIKQLNLEPHIIALFKTRNSTLWLDKEFRKDYVYITKEAAQILRDSKATAVGVDYLIIDKFQDEKRPTHHVLLEEGIIIIEGLNLSHIPAGDYYLICLPLKIKAGDGAPARAILVEL